jgi:probable rRNA maturation factor
MARRAPRRLLVTVTSPDGADVPTRGLGGWLAAAAPARTRGEVTVALVSDGRMRTLNRTFRGKDYATDVLSFPVADPAAQNGRSDPLPSPHDGYLGDIVIAMGVARRQAAEAGCPVSTEVRALALHGLLHLLGYDHETDRGVMGRLEKKLQTRAGLKIDPKRTA